MRRIKPRCRVSLVPGDRQVSAYCRHRPTKTPLYPVSQQYLESVLGEDQTPEGARAVLAIFLRAMRPALREASPGAPVQLRDAQLGAISFPYSPGVLSARPNPMCVVARSVASHPSSCSSALPALGAPDLGDRLLAREWLKREIEGTDAPAGPPPMPSGCAGAGSPLR